MIQEQSEFTNLSELVTVRLAFGRGGTDVKVFAPQFSEGRGAFSSRKYFI